MSDIAKEEGLGASSLDATNAALVNGADKSSPPSGLRSAGGHTPGPWFADGPDMFGDFNILHSLDSLAVGAVVSNLRDPAEVAANAALTAAAPELLEALQTAMQWIKAWDVGFLFDEEWSADEAKINAAIAKATGAA